MARHGDQIVSATNSTSASVPADGSHDWQNDTGENDVKVARFGARAGCASLLRRTCTTCGLPEEDWTRNIQFARKDISDNETIVFGTALFDTGANLDNLLSLHFVESCGIQFERCADIKVTPLSLWKRLWSKVFGERSPIKCWAADQHQITIVGVVEKLRWRGVAEPRCNPGLSFPQKFSDGRFLVVADLTHDAIFSCKTINDAGLRGSCSRTIAVVQQPEPTRDTSAAKKSKDAKKEQKQIQQNQEKDNRGKKGENKPPKK